MKITVLAAALALLAVLASADPSRPVRPVPKVTYSVGGSDTADALDSPAVAKVLDVVDRAMARAPKDPGAAVAALEKVYGDRASFSEAPPYYVWQYDEELMEWVRICCEPYTATVETGGEIVRVSVEVASRL